MTIRRIIELAILCVALLIAAMAVHAWLTSRDEQQRLAATMAQQRQLLDAAHTRERTRQSALDTTLSEIEKLKRATLTPQQIVGALPTYLSLPQPITLAAVAPSSVPGSPTAAQEKGTVLTRGDAAQSSAFPSVPAAQIPAADLKPLYDFIQDCRACQAQLAAAKKNASDDAARITALTAERNAAVTAAKGGTLWRRLRRNAEWFAVGAAIGSAASRASRHH